MFVIFLIPIIINLALLIWLAIQDNKYMSISEKSYLITIILSICNIVFMLFFNFQIFFISIILSLIILYVLRKVLPKILNKADIVIINFFLITSFVPMFLALVFFFLFSSINWFKNRGQTYPALTRLLIFYILGILIWVII